MNSLHITVAVVFWSDGRLRHQPKLALSRYQSTTRAVSTGWVVLGRPSIFHLVKKVVIRQEVQYEVAARRDVSAITSDPSDLHRALLKMNLIDLMGFSIGLEARRGNVDGRVDRDIHIDQASEKMTVPAVARIVSAG